MNCLTFALSVWRYRRANEYLVIRRSRWGWFPHFAVIFEREDGIIEKHEYLPLHPRRKFCPKPFFRGYVKKTYYREIPHP